MVFWVLLAALAAVVMWGVWGMRRFGGSSVDEPAVELRVPSRPAPKN